LREADAVKRGHLPPSWRDDVEPWPLDAGADYALVPAWRQTWEVLGFFPGPLLFSLVRSTLPANLPDSRVLPSLAGKSIRLAGLVAAHRKAREESGQDLLTLEDEHGLFECRLTPAARESMSPDAGPVLIVEGTVRDYFGVPGLTVGRVERPGGGGLPTAAIACCAAPGRNGAASSA
jgi:hypothetical protein